MGICTGLIFFPSLLLKIIDGKKIKPVHIPITKPPMWEKLSINGKRPKPKDITIDIINKIKSFTGFTIIFQFWTKSNNIQAIKPNIWNEKKKK